MTDEFMAAEPEYRQSRALERRGVPEALLVPVGEGGEMSSMDKRLLEIAAKYNGNISAADLAAEAGFNIAPARAAQRLREILNTRDWLSIENKIALQVEDIVDLKQYIREKMRLDDGEREIFHERGGTEVSLGDPRWTANMTKVLALLGTQLDKALARQKDAKAKISSGNAAIMVSALDRAMSKWLFRMQDLYPEIDEGIARDALEDALTAAFQVVDEQTLD